jgi:large conductance mechanosensitive channel
MVLASLWDDFKKFAFKGNMIQLAVAVVIGNAFGAVVNSLVKNILMPLVSYVSPANGGSYREWHIGRIEVGNFLGEMLNFLLVSLAMFVIVVKLLGRFENLFSRQDDPDPTVECPYCVSKISPKAIKCPQCTADLPRDHSSQDTRPVSSGTS